jgi:enoyl-CoA hydratase/carnithine racemase
VTDAVECAEFEHIRCTISDRVMTITLSRPERLNAFTLQMSRELISAIDLADNDDDVRAVIVTGAGRGFCAGADLQSGANTFARRESRSDGLEASPRDIGGLVTLRIFESKKPFIAAINGAAVGVGATMTLPMDIRIASTDAKFGFVFARRGIIPDGASSWFLSRIVGLPYALKWTLTGQMIDADEAQSSGLVSDLHAPGDLQSAAQAIAQEIAQFTSAISIAVIRHLLWRMSAEPNSMTAHRFESQILSEIGGSADAREGVMSFLEKRSPNFTGKVSSGLPPSYPLWPPSTF